MKSVKRGMLLVVVLVILTSFSGLAPEDEPQPDSPQDQEKLLLGTEFLWGYEEDCDASFDLIPKEEAIIGQEPVDCGPAREEITAQGINPLRNSVRGCPFAVENYNNPSQGLISPDGAAVAFVYEGTIFDSNNPHNLIADNFFNFYVAASWECSESDNDPGDGDHFMIIEGGVYDNRYYTTAFSCLQQPMKMKFGSYACSPDYQWYPCNIANEDKVIFGKRNVVQCLFKEGEVPEYQWERVDADIDLDGYTQIAGRDCNDGADPEGLECPTIDIKDTIGKTIEEVQDMARTKCEGKLQYSQCSICINPGAAEVCGDKVNNDCGGLDASFPEDVNDVEGETFDDCNEYQEGCIQERVHVGEEELEQPSKCSLNGDECSEDNPCPEEAGKCVPPEPTGYSKAGKNIYDEPFSWIDSAEEGGFCCGYNGVEDLGKILTQKGGEGNFICLNKELAKAEKGVQDKGIEQAFEENNCEEDWCLVNALVGAAKFKIFTLQKPGQPAFDVVSNAEEWFLCSEQGEKTLAAPSPFVAEGEEIPGEFQAISNRFRCYQEGNRWSWAECTAPDEKRKNPTIKGRYMGEGLYTLPLPITETPPEESNEDYIREELVGPSVSISHKAYKNFYPGKFLDFSGYDYLNFMVKFVADEKGSDVKLEDLKLPLEITLRIEGPEKEVLFEGNVLGYTLNSPFFDSRNFMHVRVPLPADYRGVRGVTIEASKGNFIKVRNVYLSKEGENLLCSGQNAYGEENSWIDNVDAGNPQKEISGQDICKTVYGETAWLGNDEEIDEGADSANCCGNNPNEYYAGSSKECDPTDEACQKDKHYGCWNSQSLASGQTIMNVEFNVNAYEPEYTIAYDNIVLKNFVSIKYRFLKPDAVEPYGAESYQASSFACSDPELLEVGTSFKYLCEFTFSELDLSPQSFEESLPTGHFKGKTEFSLDKIDHELVDVFFYDKITNTPLGETIKAAEAARLWNHPLAVVMALRENKYFSLKDSSGPVSKKITRSVNYSCSEPECLFPLPGNPPYQITNKHPELYELYFVTVEGETSITKKDQSFGAYGNIKAKKVAQQVLFYNDEDDAVNLPGFYGCQAADFIRDNPLVQAYFKDKVSCSVVNGMFCSPSRTVQPESDPKEWYTTTNSWSSDKIEKVGYNTEGFKEPEEQNISEYYQELELTLKEYSGSEKRNHTAAVLPARNLISNAEFTTSVKEIPHWEIFKSGGEFEPVEDERKHVKETGKVALGYGEKLHSERLAVPPAANLHFDQAQECKVEVSLVDKDGNKQQVALPEFNAGKASHAIIEFTGPCDIEKPMLQLVDEFGPAEYYKKPAQEMPETFDARAGVACCPDSFCWNGYACVEPMTKFTTLTEHIADGRDYRCIGGQWKRAVFKFDWNNQKWGFCPQEDQCFVLSSGEEKYTAKDLDHEGNFPTCVGDSEYIFDNYCQKGNWTSRTKFVAAKLLEVAENNEFVLYCSPYNDTLLDLENKENYLGGDVPKGVTEKPKDPSKKAATKVIPTCFKIQNPQIKGLLKDEQNTCINNVCVLKYKEGGQFKVAFATTLNRPIDDAKSFLFSLNLPKDACKQGKGGDFVECDLSGLDLSDSTDLYYSQDLNAVIYAKEGIKLSPGVVDKVLKWFDNLFGGIEPSEEKKFISQAQIFRDLYVLNKDGKKVRALKEIFPGVRQTLVAEYQNFKTPVCDYVQNIKVPPELELELLEKVTGVEKISCTVNGTVQKVAVNAGLDFFWPQLTGRLRVNE